jgi:hypothetical protein
MTVWKGELISDQIAARFGEVSGKGIGFDKTTTY